jgi:hypothetical protein
MKVNDIFPSRFKKVKDIRVKNALNEIVLINLEKGQRYNKAFGGYRSVHFNSTLKDVSLEEFSWSNFSEIFSLRNEYQSFTITFFEFIYFLIERGYYLGDFKTQLISNKINVLRYASSVSKRFQENHFSLDGFYPNSILFYEKSIYSEVVIVLYPDENINRIINRYFNAFDSVTNNLTKCKSDKIFFQHLTRSLGKHKISNINDFNDETFLTQVRYFINVENRNSLAYLMKFYSYILKQQDFSTLRNNFKLVDETLLGYSQLSQLLLDGYEIIQYDPYIETLPECKKYIILDNGFNSIKSYSSDIPFVFDPNFIKNMVLQNFYFRFAWNLETSFNHRKKSLSSVRDFLVFWDRKVGKNTHINFVPLDVVEVYKQSYLLKGANPNNISKKLGFVRKFLRYLDDNKLLMIDELTQDLLISPEVSSITESEYYSIDNLTTIVKSIDKIILRTKRTSNRFLSLVHLRNAISIISISEIRIEGLLDMKRDDVFLEEGKFYKAKFRSKQVIVKKNISKICYEFFIDSIRQSDEIREKTSSTINDYIFIYLRRSSGLNYIISSESLNILLHEICLDAGVKYIGMKGFRKLFNHQVTEFVKNIKQSELKINLLTGHSPQVHFNSYINHDIREHLEMVFDSFIGDMKPVGEVSNLENNLEKEDHQVRRGLGFCKANDCGQHGKLDCLMCKTFLVTPQCKPFYENAIREIDIKIEDERLYHERELLHLEKRLLVLYLTSLIELEQKGDINNGTNKL